MKTTPMNPYEEKVFFGIATMGSTAVTTLGAVLTEGETRWLFVTLASTFLTSAFLALVFKKPEESMRIVIGRCGISMLGGIFGTNPAAHWLGIESVDSNAIALGAVAALVCLAFFILGFAVLQAANARSTEFGDWVVNLAFRMFKKKSGK